MKPLVAYLRVSTQSQGKSGLGLEAQRERIAQFAAAEGLEIIAEFTETESGKGCDALESRPELRAALECARAKDRGVILGSPHLKRAIAASAAMRRAHALEDDKRVLPVIRELRAKGFSLRAVAAEMNRLGLRTGAGKDWQSGQVDMILRRNQEMQK